MDEFQFKPNGATLDGYLKIGDIQGESQIDIYNLNAIWGTNGTALEVEPALPAEVPGIDEPMIVVSFEDPLFG